jgi:prepilin-type N-terminal cleavage/methylation domain-containing protein
VKRSRGYTPIELLVTVAVFLIVSAAAAKLIMRGIEMVAMHQNRVEANRIFLDLQRTWQRGLEGSRPFAWKADGPTLDPGSSRFRAEPGKIHYERDGKSLPLYFPQGVQVQFAIEQEAQLPARAVL